MRASDFNDMATMALGVSHIPFPLGTCANFLSGLGLFAELILHEKSTYSTYPHGGVLNENSVSNTGLSLLGERWQNFKGCSPMQK